MLFRQFKASLGLPLLEFQGLSPKDTIYKLTKKKLKPRKATLCKIFNSKKEVLDEAVVIYFEKNKSFTGESVAEFQTHGGEAIIRSVLNELSKTDGLRPAEPGEFTKQAYLSGKINLVQAEGLGRPYFCSNRKTKTAGNNAIWR